MLRTIKAYRQSLTSSPICAATEKVDSNSSTANETQPRISTTKENERNHISSFEQLEIMAHHLHTIAVHLEWTRTEDFEDALVNATVAVASEDRVMVVVRPMATTHEDLLAAVIRKLDTQAILIMNNKITLQIHQRIPPMDDRLILHDNNEIIIYDTLSDVLSVKHHAKSGYCLVRDTGSVMLWSDDAKDLVYQTRECERALTRSLYTVDFAIATTKAQRFQPVSDEKHAYTNVSVKEVSSSDLERSTSPQLPVRFIWPIIVACTFLIMGLANGQLLSALLVAVLLDGTYHQVVFALYIPMACFLSAVSSP